jgi:PAP2 superfamily C-terminal
VRVRLAARVAASFVFRVTCNAVMVWFALFAEARATPGPLPDVVMDLVPYVPWVDQNNYLLWLVAYVPVALWLLATDAERFIRYMVSSGTLALLRGLCIAATGLGAISPTAPSHVGMSAAARWEAWLHLTTPLGFFDRASGARVALTKDLFFSGHTATTFLLLLYVWRFPRLRWPMVVAHAVVVASVFLAHLHYTIDVIGAYAITFSLYAVREWRQPRAGSNALSVVRPPEALSRRAA